MTFFLLSILYKIIIFLLLLLKVLLLLNNLNLKIRMNVLLDFLFLLNS